jgi:hypothetical protein
MADIERQAYGVITDKGGTAVQRVFTAGGGSKNPVWMALRMQALGVPVQESPNGATIPNACLGDDFLRPTWVFLGLLCCWCHCCAVPSSGVLFTV